MDNLLTMIEPVAKQMCRLAYENPDEIVYVPRSWTVLPGWWVTCGMCDLSGHASIGPDYNGPHRERLLREWPQEQFHSGFDEDLEPGGNWSATCRAIIVCLLMAKQAETQP